MNKRFSVKTREIQTKYTGDPDELPLKTAIHITSASDECENCCDCDCDEEYDYDLDEDEQSYIFKIIAILAMMLVAGLITPPGDGIITLILIIFGARVIWNM